MVRVLDAAEAPLAWRVTDPSVLEALCRLEPGQAVTDGQAYDDRYEASKAVEAYRVLFRRLRSDARLRCRIAYYADEKYRWFARVEPREPA